MSLSLLLYHNPNDMLVFLGVSAYPLLRRDYPVIINQSRSFLTLELSSIERDQILQGVIYP